MITAQKAHFLEHNGYRHAVWEYSHKKHRWYLGDESKIENMVAGHEDYHESTNIAYEHFLERQKAALLEIDKSRKGS